VYHLADGWDAGAVAKQDWCFVGKNETARELWERALAPMGLRLLTEVVREARDTGSIPEHKQDERFATRAPMIKRTVSLTEDNASMITSLVVTVVGPDRRVVTAAAAARAGGSGLGFDAGAGTKGGAARHDQETQDRRLHKRLPIVPWIPAALESDPRARGNTGSQPLETAGVNDPSRSLGADQLSLISGASP